jgi:quercetin 2,3-dioxygenase
MEVSEMTGTQAIRSAARIVTAEVAADGDGVAIHRAFPARALDSIDPFLLLDQLGPTQYAPGTATGFPDHPHRGFETVTYLLEGEFQHRDSMGNHGTLLPGDVQWMTAGSGLVHSELPGDTLVRDGGVLHGFQLWVNLPKRDKMAAPRYQEVPGAGIPEGRDAAGGVTARVIAGEALATAARIETHTPIFFLHFTLQPGAVHVQPVPHSYNAFAYVIQGEAELDGEGTRAKPRDVAIFARDGEAVRIANTGAEPLSLLLIGGEPIGEPVARYGPFVMNTKEELYQAFEDFRQGRMGSIG